VKRIQSATTKRAAVPGALVVVAVVAVSIWKVAHSPAGRAGLPPLSAEQVELVRTAAEPDPFSESLEPVLASLPERLRDIVVREPDEELRLLRARAWAMRPGNVHGDDGEVSLFLDRLEAPLNVQTEPTRPSAADPAARRAADIRVAALYGLLKAIEIAGPYDEELLQRIERAAVAHLSWPIAVRRDAVETLAAAVLLSMESRQELSEPAQRALEQALQENPLLEDDAKRNVQIMRDRLAGDGFG